MNNSIGEIAPHEFRGLICTDDPYQVRILVWALAKFSIAADVFSDPNVAGRVMEQKSYDCAIIDCEREMPHVVLRAICHSPANRNCVVAVILNTLTMSNPAATLGMHIRMFRPTSFDHALHCVRPLYGQILCRRRPTFSPNVEIPAVFVVNGKESFSGSIIEISAYGMSIRCAQRLSPGRIEATVVLPSAATLAKPIQLVGAITSVTPDATEATVRFGRASISGTNQLRRWLDSEFDRMYVASEPRPGPVSLGMTIQA